MVKISIGKRPWVDGPILRKKVVDSKLCFLFYTINNESDISVRAYDLEANRWLTNSYKEEDNPIYDSKGNFRGVDESGLRGEAIIYDGEFSNGMSQSEILSNGGVFLNDFTGLNSVLFKIKFNQIDLKDRPDWDGVLTLSEANDWFRNGNGESLYVDASKIDLSPLSVDYFDQKNPRYYNFFTDGQGDTTTGRVYGTIHITLLDEFGKVRLGGNNGYLDKYDFDIKPNKNNDLKVGFRNFGTHVGKILANGLSEGKPFKIFNFGYGRIRMSD